MWGFVLALYFILVFHPDHSKPFMTVQQDRSDQPAAAVEITWSTDIHREVIKRGDALLTHLFCSPTILSNYTAPAKLNPVNPRASDQTTLAQ